MSKWVALMVGISSEELPIGPGLGAADSTHVHQAKLLRTSRVFGYAPTCEEWTSLFCNFLSRYTWEGKTFKVESMFDPWLEKSFEINLSFFSTFREIYPEVTCFINIYSIYDRYNKLGCFKCVFYTIGFQHKELLSELTQLHPIS